MNLAITTVKKHPVSAFFVVLYTAFLLVILYSLHKPSPALAVHGGIFQLILVVMAAVVSLVLTILLALFSKERSFYLYLSAYIVLSAFLFYVVAYL